MWGATCVPAKGQPNRNLSRTSGIEDSSTGLASGYRLGTLGMGAASHTAMNTEHLQVRRCRSCAAVLMAIALAAPLAAAPSSGAAGPAAATAAPVIRIDNFARVDARLYRGAQPKGRDFADLKALGVKTVVNLTSHDADPDEQAMAEAAGLT